MGIADVIAPEEIARIPETVNRLAGGTVDRNEWRFKRKDGSFFIGEVVGCQLPDGRLQGILRDVTAQKQTVEKSRLALRGLRVEIVHRGHGFVRWTSVIIRVQQKRHFRHDWGKGSSIPFGRAGRAAISLGG